MKTLLSFLFLLITTSVFAQKHPFIRVFTNVNGKTGKTVRGKLTTITDSSITVKGKTISYLDIYMIKTKRSFGHSLWSYTLGGLACGTAAGFLTVLADKNDTRNLGLILLPPLGTMTGLTISIPADATKKSNKFYIYNDLQQWQIAKAALAEKMK
jgi:hypothetical protein